MFQCVVLSVSSDVILFHRRRTEHGLKNGGGRPEQHIKPETGKRGSAQRAAPNRKKRKDGTKTAKDKL